jgi:hypothetical protein
MLGLEGCECGPQRIEVTAKGKMRFHKAYCAIMLLGALASRDASFSHVWLKAAVDMKGHVDASKDPGG